MTNDTRPLMVSIWCMTYNHEPFIRQCLDGFIMQKTNFRFEAVVHDDASTDGTAAIVREYAEKYPNIIKPIFESENQYSKHDGSLDRIMDETCTGKYIAICEGDDYWIDPLKLQKQVDFLEKNPDYSLCFTDVKNYYSENKKEGEYQSSHYGNENRLLEFLDKKEVFYKIILSKCRIQTLTVLYPKSLLNTISPNTIQFMMGDTPTWLDLSQIGRIKYIEECTGVYRIHKQSLSRNMDLQSRFCFSMFEMRIYYCKKYNYAIPNSIKRNYNKSLGFIELKKIKNEREPLYEMFPMNILQQKLFLLARNFNILKKFIFLMWKIEKIIRLLKKRLQDRY